MNKVFLMGNLGQDPEVRYAQSGTAIANLSLATTEKRGDDSSTTWHRIVAFGRQAEVIGEYCKKGSKLLVEGRIQNRDWEDRDGNTRKTIEVVLERFEFVGGKAEAKPEKRKELAPEQTTIPEDDIPF